MSQLDRDGIMKDIDNEMGSERFTKSEEPDVLINVLLKTKTQVQATATKTIDAGASADKKDANITCAMEQVFRNYPPPQ